MPKVHFVKKARKDNPAVKKNEEYYWWKFRFGGMHYSKTYPKPAQLTQSEFLGQVYELNERLDSLEAESFEDLQNQLQEIADEFRALGDECEDKKSNMSDQLQNSKSGQLLEDRSYYCGEISDNLESIDCEIDENEMKEEIKDEIKNVTKKAIEKILKETKQERLEELLDEVRGYQYEGA